MLDHNPAKLVFERDPNSSRRPEGQRSRWADLVERDLASVRRDRGWSWTTTNMNECLDEVRWILTTLMFSTVGLGHYFNRFALSETISTSQTYFDLIHVLSQSTFRQHILHIKKTL